MLIFKMYKNIKLSPSSVVFQIQVISITNLFPHSLIFHYYIDPTCCSRGVYLQSAYMSFWPCPLAKKEASIIDRENSKHLQTFMESSSSCFIKFQMQISTGDLFLDFLLVHFNHFFDFFYSSLQLTSDKKNRNLVQKHRFPEFSTFFLEIELCV